MSRRVQILGSALLAVVLIASIATVTMSKPGNPCLLRNSGFQAAVSASVYNGPPPYPVCLQGVPLIKVDVTITQGFNVIATDSEVKCGVLSDPVLLSGGGHDFVVAPDNGYDWQDALTNCNSLTFKVN